MTSRIGVMGGMFDPVHQGHRSIALAALDILKLDQLRVIPCSIPNHRVQAHGTAVQRTDMLRLAMQDIPEIVIDTREIERDGISYSFDTLSSLQAEYESDSLIFIMGLDAFNSLPQWYRWQEFIELCHLAIFERPESQIDPITADKVDLSKRRVHSVEELELNATGKIIILNEVDMLMSSSQVRECLLNSTSVEGLLAPQVASYISEHELYGQKSNT